MWVWTAKTSSSLFCIWVSNKKQFQKIWQDLWGVNKSVPLPSKTNYYLMKAKVLVQFRDIADHYYLDFRWEDNSLWKVIPKELLSDLSLRYCNQCIFHSREENQTTHELYYRKCDSIVIVPLQPIVCNNFFLLEVHSWSK